MSGLSGMMFFGGAIGATATLLVTQVLPVLADWKAGIATPQPTFWKVVGALLFALIFVALGGLFAAFVAAGDPEIRNAVVYGIGWQGSWSSLAKGSAAVRVLQAG